MRNFSMSLVDLARAKSSLSVGKLPPFQPPGNLSTMRGALIRG